ncbi:MAG: hypothetical protein IT452_11635 [Planctomycetia bacterium]|nr:hypothetical protein [Planctomycetia bacterium]
MSAAPTKDPRILVAIAAACIAALACWSMARGFLRTRRSGNRRHMLSALASAHFVGALLAGGAEAFTGAGAHPWLDATMWVMLAACATCAVASAVAPPRLPVVSAPGHPLLLAERLHTTGNWAEAVALAQSVASREPEQHAARLGLASLLARSAEPVGASDVLSRVDPQRLDPVSRGICLDLHSELGVAVSREDGTGTAWLVFAGLGLLTLAAVGSASGREAVVDFLPGLAALLLILALPMGLQSLRSLRVRRLRTPRRNAPAVRAAIAELAAAGRLDLAVELGRFRLSIRPDDDDSRIETADCVLRSGDARLAASVLNGLSADLRPETRARREDIEARIRTTLP